MKNVRIWFRKIDEAVYISHLDLNRTVLRAIVASGLDVWYTEGFNPHPFVTFALPLSLGIAGLSESFDVRLMSDVSKEDIINGLNKYLPDSIKVFDVSEPVMKPKEIVLALFKIVFEKDVLKNLNSFLNKPSIVVQKKTKSGTKEFDLKQKIITYEISKNENSTDLFIQLPAGNIENVNPMLLIEKFSEYIKDEVYCSIMRKDLLNENNQIWR